MTLKVQEPRTQYTLPPYRLTIRRTDVIGTDLAPGTPSLGPLDSLPAGTDSLTVLTWTDEKIILTDDHSPVDNMLSEVVSQRAGLAH